MMKKMMSVALAVLFVSAVAFAGGGGEKAAAPAGKQKIVVTVWDDPALSGMNEIAASFMKENPNVEVEVQLIPYERYEDKVRTVLAAGDVPDVVQVNDDYVVTYTNRGLLLPLTQYVKKLKLNPDDYYKAVWDFNWVKGEMMAFAPMNKVRLVIYNKDALKAAGLPEPSSKWGDPSWNWDTFRDYANKLTKRNGNVTTQWGVVGYGDGATEQIWTANANGEGLFGSDGKTATGTNKEAREAIQYLADLIHKDKVHPLWGESNTGAKVDNIFLSGQAAMRLGGTFSFGALRKSATFDWDVAPEPMKKFSTNEGSLVCYGVPKKSKNPEAAAKFVFYLGEEYAQKIFAEKGNVPVTKKFAQKYYIQPGVKPSRQQVVLDGMDHNKSVNYTDYTDEGKRLYRVYLHKVWAGEMGVDAAMDAAKIEVEAALAGKR